MTIEITDNDIKNIKVVHVSGRLDATSAPVLEKHIQPFCSETGMKLLINMRHVDYLSSAGMRVMLSATKKIAANKGRCAFCELNNNVMEIIKMAGFEKILEVHPTEASALKNLSG